MSLNGLKFFVRTNVPLSWNVASFHSRHSLTWSWILSFGFFRGDAPRVRPIWYAYRDNNGLQWGFRIPWVGLVRWSRQQPMWYRDICRAEWERRDNLPRQRTEAAEAERIAKLAHVQAPSEALH